MHILHKLIKLHHHKTSKFYTYFHHTSFYKFDKEIPCYIALQTFPSRSHRQLNLFYYFLSFRFLLTKQFHTQILRSTTEKRKNCRAISLVDWEVDWVRCVVAKRHHSYKDKPFLYYGNLTTKSHNLDKPEGKFDFIGIYSQKRD